MYGGKGGGGKKVGGREEERKAKVWSMKVRMETKGWKLETDEAVSGGGEGELGKGRTEAMNRSGEWGGARRRTYSKRRGPCVIRLSVDTWRADICVGQLALWNGISAQITFHTWVDSPATLSKLKHIDEFILAVWPRALTHICVSTCKGKTHQHTQNIALLSVVINLNWSSPAGYRRRGEGVRLSLRICQ